MTACSGLQSARSPWNKGTTGCLQRLERAYDSLAGLGNETAAMGELARPRPEAAGSHTGPDSFERVPIGTR